MNIYMVNDDSVAIAYSWTDLVVLGQSGYCAVSKIAWDKKREELQNQTSVGEESNLDRAVSSSTDL